MPNIHKRTNREAMRRYIKRCGCPEARCFSKENAIDTPEMNKNNGLIRSQQENPIQLVCAICVLSHAGGSFVEVIAPASERTRPWPPTIQNMSKPRSASMETTRSVAMGEGCGPCCVCPGPTRSGPGNRSVVMLISFPPSPSEADSADCSRPVRMLSRFMHRQFNRLDEIVAQCGDFFRLHKALLQPQPIIHRERLVFFNRVFEIGTEAAIFPFTEPSLLGVLGAVEVGHRVSLSTEHK